MYCVDDLQVMTQVSRCLGYPSLRNYMTSHLPYLINEWTKLNNKLDEFPWKLCDYSSLRDFYR